VSAAVSVRNLSAGYGPIRVLHDVSLEVPRGELTVIVGANGAGKTTLLRALSGLIVRSGEVTLDGEPLPDSPAAIVARGLVQVPEGRQLFPQMTVEENLELGAWRATRAERAARLAEAYGIFPRLAERRRQLAGTMSGGEQQMLAVGRALMARPKVLLLDEPSLGLAPRAVDDLLATVRRIRDSGITVLLVEQNVAKALAIADGAYVLERGAVAMEGRAETLLRSPRLRDAYLGAEAKPGATTWKGGIFMQTSQTTAVTIASENAWKGKLFTGRWQTARGGSRPVIEPATAQVLTEVGFADVEDVREAARTAREAQRAWAETPAEERADVLRRAAQLLEANAESLRPWIVRETGCIPPKADFEIRFVTRILIEAGSIATQPPGVMLPSGPRRMSFARRVPHGVVGVISPFNFPLILSARAVAPALALGNAVVLKPDPQTPVTGGFILARLFEAAGLPAGLLHVLPGGAATGEAIITDPDIAMISFTGSTATGRKVGELASRHLKKVTLELGGKNSTVVLEDADLDVAASCVAWGAYLHQGQICMATGTVLAHRAVARDLTERLVAKAKSLRVGDPLREQVAIGPIINARQLERVDGIVKDALAKGAVLRAGGAPNGPYYPPTVLEEVRPGMRILAEEVFGPVVAVVPFDTDEEAIEVANGTEYGLSVGVITQSVERALRFAARLRSGIVHINDQTVGDEPWVPFGGTKASGNGGRHGGVANWEEFTQWQWVTIQDRATPYPF